MKKGLVLWSVIAAGVISCRQQPAIPDVSGYRAEVKVQRFDQDFFSADTLRLGAEMSRLQVQYPDFFPAYLEKMLGLSPGMPGFEPAVADFLRSYRPVQAAAMRVAEEHLPELSRDLTLSLKLMQHYVRGWKPEQPFVVTTFIGPMDAYEPFALGDYGDVRTAGGVGVALQFHLGADARVYEEGEKAGIFFNYQTQRFTPETMVVNAMKNVVEDAFPYQPQNLNLVEDMVEKGKRMALLKRVLPHVADTLLLGYTSEQLKGCEANEALIWNYFVKNDLLFSKEPLINQQYLKDGPKTPELGQGAPGYIGLFTGWKIAEAWLRKFSDVPWETFMKKSPKEIFEQSGYKP